MSVVGVVYVAPPLPPLQVEKCLSSLQTEVENVILRMAAEFPLRKEQLLFLINNYDMLLSVLQVTHPLTTGCSLHNTLHGKVVCIINKEEEIRHYNKTDSES